MRVRNVVKTGLLAICSISLLLCSPSVALADSDDGERLTSPVVEADVVSAEDADGIEGRANGSSSWRVSSVTGVKIGTGFHARKQIYVDQNAVYANALDAVIRWRRDAYNDSSVKLEYNGSYVTVRQYLSNAGINVSEYLSPKWSNALERIALQRVVEAGDDNLGNRRPDGSYWHTATYNGVGSEGEMLQWGAGNICQAIDYWGAEKAQWIKFTNGESNYGEYSNYLMLITPEIRSYGFAQAPATRFDYVFTCEYSTNVFSDQSPTRIEGPNNTFDATLNLAWLDSDFVTNVPKDGLLVGRPLLYVIVPEYSGGEYNLVGTLGVDSPSLVSVENDFLVPHAAGTVTVYLTDDAGNSIPGVYEVRFFSDVPSMVDHADDINWMGETGISTGFANGDGTFAFQPYASVARCDMAAFLYRIAGSPAYEAPASSPFSDVTPDTPHYREICWLAESGVSRGFGDGTFRPYATVVRQDMAAFLRRLSAWAGNDVSSAGGSPFSDVRDGDEANHASDVCWLAANGVSAGFPDGTFGGMRNVARCDMAAFLRRMSDKGLV